VNPRVRSLRSQLLVPFSVAAVGAAVCVAAASYWMGDRRAAAELRHRVSALSATLAPASFPLTPSVLNTLGELTSTRLVTFSADGKLLQSTLDFNTLPQSSRMQDLLVRELSEWVKNPSESIRRLPGFRVVFFRRLEKGTSDTAVVVAVLFDESSLREARWQAVSLPLTTGLSTLVLLSLLSWLITRRLVTRISRLQTDVARIASGDFTVPLIESAPDELGQLSGAVQTMGAELQKLWAAVNRVERQKLIHQMAAGLAHQIRNSLTGARMALEIHSRSCNHDAESLSVAHRELAAVENYVSRILLLGSAKSQELQPGTVEAAIGDIRQSLDTLAKHHKIEMRWLIETEVTDCIVTDQRSLTAAMQNLILNALQAGGNSVEVTAGLIVDSSSQPLLRILVVDDGPGPNVRLGEDIFESFVSSKPEGLGLGLSIVRRAAETLGGGVKWERGDGRTRFELLAKIDPNREKKRVSNQHI
jgi:signal transduction histidine kinase